jgi:hypothetical protein
MTRDLDPTPLRSAPGSHLHSAAVRAVAALLLLAPLAVAQDDGAKEVSDLPVPAAAPSGTAAIDLAGLREHAFFFASDERKGRYTGTPGQLAVARYIAKRFEDLGLEPFGDRLEEGDGRSWFFDVPLERTRLADGSGIKVVGKDEIKDRYAVLPADTDQPGCDLEGDFVFCGIGRPDELPPEDQDLSNVIPVVAFGIECEPKIRLEAALGMAGRPIVRAKGIAKKLADRGAKVLVVCLREDENPIAALMNYMGLTPDKPKLRYGPVGSGDPLGMFAANSRIPIVFVSAAPSGELLGALGVSWNEDGDPVAAEKAPASVRGAVRLDIVSDRHAAPNVVGLLRGSDPELSKEAIVYSAHMDHMGMRMDGDAYNGADDNASGSSGLLEVAEAFATAGQRPKRSVILLSVCGEELGLWGSRHFAENPTWPVDDIVANINIDMIGRVATLSGPQEVSITPSYRHPMFSTISRRSAELAQELGLDLTIGDEFYTRSDHYNFAERGIPVVFFCDGEHEDYHQVTDTPDKLDYEKIQRVVRLAYWTGVEIANGEGRPETIGRQPDWFEDASDREGR